MARPDCRPELAQAGLQYPRAAWSPSAHSAPRVGEGNRPARDSISGFIIVVLVATVKLRGPHRAQLRSSDFFEPPDVPGDLLKALALIKAITRVVVRQAVEVDVVAAGSFQVFEHPAEHLATKTVALKRPADCQDVDEAE